MKMPNCIKSVLVLSICFLLLTGAFSSVFVSAAEDDTKSVEDTYIDKTSKDEKRDLDKTVKENLKNTQKKEKNESFSQQIEKEPNREFFDSDRKVSDKTSFEEEKGYDWTDLSIQTNDLNSIETTHIGLTGVEKSGTVSDETWTSSNGPYWITDNITVPSGHFLKIGSRTNIIFNGTYNIFVEGEMQAIGTSTDYVNFTKNDTITSWGSIQFNETSTGTLSYCNITSSGDSVVIDSSEGIDINNCKILYNYGYGILAKKGGFSIERNTFITSDAAVYVDISYVNPNYVNIGDMVLTNNDIKTPVGFLFNKISILSPMPSSNINVGETIIYRNNFTDIYGMGEGIGILLSDYSVINMNGGSISWGDINVAENNVSFPDGMGGIGLFPMSPCYVVNLTDVEVKLGSIDVSYNTINIPASGAGMYVSNWASVMNQGLTDVTIREVRVTDNKMNVSNTGLTFEYRGVGNDLYDESTIHHNNITIQQNDITSGYEAIEIFCFSIGENLYNDSTVTTGDFSIIDNMIESGYSGIYLEYYDVGIELYDHSTFKNGDIVIAYNDISSARDGINIDMYNIGYNLNGDSQVVFNSLLVIENQIDADENGIELNDLSDWGTYLEDDSSFAMDSIKVNDNTIISGYDGIYCYIRNFAYYMNYYTPGHSSFSMGNFEFCGNVIDSYGYGYSFYDIEDFGRYMYNESTAFFGDFLINDNDITSIDDGIYFYDDLCAYIGYYIEDNATVTFGDIEVNYNTVLSDSEGIYLDYILYDAGYELHGNAFVEIGHVQINWNDVESEDGSIYVYEVGYVGSYLYDNSRFSMNNFEIQYNTMYSYSSRGLYFDYLEYIGYYLQDNSSVEFGSFKFNNNLIYSYSDGMYFYDIYEIGYDLSDNSSMIIGNFEFTNNIITSSDGYGMYLYYFDYFGENLYGAATFNMGNVLINDNEIHSDYDSIYVDEFYEFGSGLYGEAQFTMENIEICRNDVKSTNSEGIYIDSFEYFAYDVDGYSTFSMGRILINSNKIESNNDGMFIGRFKQFGNRMYHNSIATITGIAIDDNVITATDSVGIYIVSFRDFGSVMYDDSVFIIGDISINANVIDCPYGGLHVNRIQNMGYEMNDRSSFSMGNIEIAGNDITSENNNGIYLYGYQIGYDLKDESSAHLGGFIINENQLTTTDRGIYFETDYLGFDMNGTASFTLQNIEVSTNTISSENEEAVYFEMRNTMRDVWDNSSVTLNGINLDSNTLETSSSDDPALEISIHSWMELNNYSAVVLDGLFVTNNEINGNVSGMNMSFYDVPMNIGPNNDIAGDDFYINGNLIKADKTGLGIDWDSPNPEGIQPYFLIDDTTITGRSSADSIGLYMNNVNDTYMENLHISNFDKGAYLENTTVHEYINGSISDTTQYSFNLTEDSDVYTINTTFDDTQVVFMDYESLLEVAWYMHVSVETTIGYPVKDADVIVSDTYGTEVYNGSSESDGIVKDIICMDYVKNITGVLENYNDYTAWADKLGLDNDVTVTMDSTKWVTVVLADDDKPSITDDTSETPETGANFTFDATVSDNFEIAEVYICYYFETQDGATTAQNITMDDLGGGSYSFTVPVAANSTGVSYYISAMDTSGNWRSTSENSLYVTDTISPTADAGDDQTVTVETEVTFDSSGSSDNIAIDNHTWSFTYGGVVTTLTGESPTFTFDEVGVYEIELTVSDEEGNQDTDSLTVTVTDDIQPTADAGDDQTIGIGDTVNFDGSASSDNLGIVNFSWSFTYDGNEIELDGVDSSFTFEILGAYTVMLTVEDESGNTDTDSITVTVEDQTSPIADAGSDKTVEIGDTVNFDGSSSTDNVEVISYLWTFTYDGEEITLTGVNPSYTFETEGVYTVTLRVEDEAGNHDTDSITVTVEDTDGGDDEVSQEGAFSWWLIALILVIVGSILVALIMLRRKQEPLSEEELIEEETVVEENEEEMFEEDF